MENSIIKDFQNLQVLNKYEFKRMDALVQDLTKALEETGRSQPKSSKGNHEESGPSSHNKHEKGIRKRRARKRRPNTSCSGGNFSEASESSIEEALLRSITQRSDSDELLVSSKSQLAAVYPLPASYPLALVESDSVNECLSPMKPPRRKRHFKRMAVDPDSDNSLHLQSDGTYARMPVCSTKEKDFSECSMMDDEIPNLSVSPSATEVLPGKRKRAVRDKSFDTDTVLSESGETTTAQATANVGRSSSSISSSESDGLFTNDEGRDGDDEHSDFFYEPGPTCGIIPWWESERLQTDSERDLKFEAILKGSFEYMSAAAQKNFKRKLRMIGKQTGREIRLGRRRCKERNPGYTLTRFLQDREKWSDSLRFLSRINGNQSNDPKRRRKTPPTSANESEIVGGSADPIPESNIGNRMLQNLGWKPGTGLGADGGGLMTPVMAVKRSGRHGIGSANNDML